jgi:hypothetical protein
LQHMHGTATVDDEEEVDEEEVDEEEEEEDYM